MPETNPPRNHRPDYIPDSERHQYPWLNGAGKHQDYVPAGKSPEILEPETRKSPKSSKP